MSSVNTHSRLPALKLGPDGERRVNYLAVIALAWPLFMQFGVQAFLSITDTWFVGRISTDAIASMNAVNFTSFVMLLALAGPGIAVQTIAAQRYGAGRKARASQAAWQGVWFAVMAAPVAVLVGFAGAPMFAFFGLPPTVAQGAAEYWLPRMAGGVAVILTFALGNFFNGIGRTRVALMGVLIAAVLNVFLDWLLILELGLGMFGAGLASSLASVAAVVFYFVVFLSRPFRAEFATTRTWRFNLPVMGTVLALGIPIGLHSMLDVGAFAAFQLMVGKLGAVPAAATQIAMILTSLGFLPAAGLSFAAATLVGQSIGAGDKAWARRVGSASVKIAFVYMACWAVLFATCGEWLTSLFLVAGDPDAAAVIALGGTLLLIAAGYQLFDALNLGCVGCLRGAGDVIVPSIALVLLAWLVFVPLSHMLIFEPGQGWVDFLPQYGMGAKGGWIAAFVHIALLGSFLLLRWLSNAWHKRSL
jgi:multidrug resistance protein, MATE family